MIRLDCGLSIPDSTHLAAAVLDAPDAKEALHRAWRWLFYLGFNKSLTDTDRGILRRATTELDGIECAVIAVLVRGGRWSR